MTITISTISKTKKAVYWLATRFTAIAYFVIGAVDILHAPMIMASLERLGYPVYLATILGPLKRVVSSPLLGVRTAYPVS